jgi:hypothetical protein
MSEVYAGVPLLHQTPVAIVPVSWTDLAAIKLRNTLECFSYCVDFHRVRSRPQFADQPSPCSQGGRAIEFNVIDGLDHASAALLQSS